MTPESAAELMLQVITGRAERAVTMVTTDLPFSEWTTLFPNVKLCEASLDMLTDQAYIIETGEPARQQEIALGELAPQSSQEWFLPDTASHKASPSAAAASNSLVRRSAANLRHRPGASDEERRSRFRNIDKQVKLDANPRVQEQEHKLQHASQRSGVFSQSSSRKFLMR
jgi:hypothetical protein